MKKQFIVTAVFLTLFFTFLTGQNPTLVKNIGGYNNGCNPESAIAVGSSLYFVADDGVHGEELWISDAAGTRLVKDIFSQPEQGTVTVSSAFPRDLIAFGGKVFFSAVNQEGRLLWKSDGTPAGTVQVKYDGPALPGTTADYHDPHDFKVAGSLLYFAAPDAGGDMELWKSDGTAAGTQRVKNISAAGSSNPKPVAAVGNTLYFIATDGITGKELWKSDGTAAGTTMVRNINTQGDAEIASVVVSNGVLYFSAQDQTGDRELWKSDGTANGTVLLKNINPIGSSDPQWLYVFNNAIYFSASSSATGRELWKSNGTAAGTVLLKDIAAADHSSNPARFKAVGSTLFFVATDGVSGRELWKTNGTAAGTFMVKNIHETPYNSSDPEEMTITGGTLFFSAYHPSSGRELWKSNGTAAGTVLVRDIYTGGVSSDLHGFVALGTTLYFAAYNGVSGTELWKSNGTAGGTSMVKDINRPSSNPMNLTKFGNTLYFTADDGAHGTELWKSDGTAAGTVLVKDIFPGNNGSYPYNLTVMNGVLYFIAINKIGMDPDPERHIYQLWKSDGTTNGTVMVKDLEFYEDGGPQELTPLNGVLYFSANDGINGRELWKSNGTAAGTSTINVPSNASGSHPEELTAVGNTLYFTADNGVNGRELWKIAGNAAPVMVKDIKPGSAGSEPEQLVNIEGKLLFSASMSGIGREVFISDGTSNGTKPVKDINPGSDSSYPYYLTNVGGYLFFTAYSSVQTGKELWKSDGTSAGTYKVQHFNPTVSTTPSHITSVNGKAFFRATNAFDGYELWTSDGTSAGTFMVKDIGSGTGVSGLENDYLSQTILFAAGNTLYFTAKTDAAGNELWKSDGTSAGTVMVTDLRPGVGTSNPGPYFAMIGTTLFFAANDGTNGQQLFKIENAGLVDEQVEDRNGVWGDESATNQPNSNGEALAFPNPTHGVLWLKFQAVQFAQSAKVVIMDARGRVVAVQGIENGASHVEFDLRQEPDGIYLYQILVDGKTAMTEKVMLLK